jgi:hypothetical protein
MYRAISELDQMRTAGATGMRYPKRLMIRRHTSDRNANKKMANRIEARKNFGLLINPARSRTSAQCPAIRRIIHPKIAPISSTLATGRSQGRSFHFELVTDKDSIGCDSSMGVPPVPHGGNKTFHHFKKPWMHIQGSGAAQSLKSPINPSESPYRRARGDPLAHFSLWDRV